LFHWKNRLVAIPEIFHSHLIHDQLAVEVDRHLLAFHHNMKGIPVANRIVGQNEWFAWMFLIIIQPSRTYLRAHVYTRGVPDLYLGRSTEINPGIALLFNLPVDVHFEVTVLIHGADVIPMTGENEFPIFRIPSLPHALIGF